MARRSTQSLGCMARCVLPQSLAGRGCCSYNNQCASPSTRSSASRTLADRGLDFEDAVIVFEGITVEVEDLRKDYGERRIICYGLLSGRLVVVGYTPREKTRHIFSMRKANDREKARLAPYFEIRSRES